jgi:predicted transcriptional regulator
MGFILTENCTMNMEAAPHHGEAVMSAIKKVRFSMDVLADKMNMGRTTLYRQLKNPDFSLADMVKIGKIIGYDFSKQFPEIITMQLMMDEPETPYYLTDNAKTHAKLEQAREKVIEMAEKNMNLQDDLIAMYKEMNEMLRQRERERKSTQGNNEN